MRLLNSLTEQVCNVTKPEYSAWDYLYCLILSTASQLFIIHTHICEEVIDYFQVASVTSHVRDLIKKVREKAYQTSKVEVFLWYELHIKYLKNLLKCLISPFFFDLGFVFSGREISSIAVLPSRHHTFDEYKDRRRKSEGQQRCPQASHHKDGTTQTSLSITLRNEFG